MGDDFENSTKMAFCNIICNNYFYGNLYNKGFVRCRKCV